MPSKKARRKRQTTINFSPASKTAPPPKRHQIVLLDSDSEEAIPNRAPKRRRLEKQPPARRSEDEFGSDDAIEVSSNSSSDEQSEGHIVVVKPRKGKSRKRSELDGDSDDGIIPHSRTKRRRNGGRAVDVGDDKEQMPRLKKGSQQRKPTVYSEDSDEPEEEAPPPRRAHHRKGRRKSSHDSSSDRESRDADENEASYDEGEELQEELEFLRSSPAPDRGRLRSTHDKPKSEREKALEALKKRRGRTAEPSSATPSRKKPVVLDSDSDAELDVIQEDIESNVSNDDESTGSEDESNDEPITNAASVFFENAEDEEFIDDDDALIGTPADLSAIPLQFSSLSRAKPRELFKYAVEWMVHKKLNPAFAADDEIYDFTFRKLNDEVNGLANSKYHSSAWTQEFTRAIRARPDLVLNEIGKHVRGELEPHCEACNRKTHIASWEASLTGSPYDKNTLEPLVDDSDSSSESESGSSLSSRASSVDSNGEKPAYDASGERLAPESRTFALGSTCKGNAQVAHTLYHWRYHLNSWVVDYLVREGHCTPKKLAKRDKWSVKKRAKYANKIVDKMEAEGEIRKLHRLYKDQVDFALEAKNDHVRGGWNSSGR